MYLSPENALFREGKAHVFFIRNLDQAIVQMIITRHLVPKTGIKGQSKVYFITWPEQNVTGQLLLFSLTEVGQHLFEANINGAIAFCELKKKFEM